MKITTKLFFLSICISGIYASEYAEQNIPYVDMPEIHVENFGAASPGEPEYNRIVNSIREKVHQKIADPAQRELKIQKIIKQCQEAGILKK